MAASYVIYTILTALLLLSATYLMINVPLASYGESNGSQLVVIKRGDVELSYPTISEAVEDADPGSTIIIYPGVYKEHILVQKPLRIIGVGQPVIDGEGSGTVITILNTSNVVIEGLKVVNSGRFYSTEDSGIKIEWSKNVSIRKVVMENVFYPIYVRGSEDVVIEGNNISSIPEYHVAYRGHGVYVWYSNRVTIRNNYFYTLADGVYGDHAYNLTVEGNRIEDGRYGVHLMYCKDVLIVNNLITRTIAGLVPMYSDRVNATKNFVVLVRGGGIGQGVFVQESDNIVIEENVISGNIIGVYVGRTPYRPGSTAIIKRNLVAFNLIGVKIDTISEVLFVDNSFIENVKDVILVGYGKPRSIWYDPLAYRGNFWSDKTLADSYVSESNLIEELLEEHKELKVFMFSPSYLMLEVLVSKNTGGTRVKAVDLYPLRSPTMSVTSIPKLKDKNPLFSMLIPSLTLLSSLGVIRVIRRRGVGD